MRHVLLLTILLWPRLLLAAQGSPPQMTLVLQAPAPEDALDLRQATLRTDVSGSRVHIDPAAGPSIGFSLVERALHMGAAPSSALAAPGQQRAGACTIHAADAGVTLVALAQEDRAPLRECWRSALPAPATAITVSGDERLVVAALADGSLRWFAATTGQPLLALALAPRRKAWVAWTPSGYYDAMAEGAERLGWQVARAPGEPTDFFAIRLFSQRLRRPDLISRVLFVQDERRALQEVNAEAGLPAATTPLSQHIPPVLRVLSPASGSVVSAPRLRVRYSVRSPSGAPIRELRLLVRGQDALHRGATSRHLLRAAPTPPEEAVYEEDVDLPAEDAVLTLRAETAQAAAEPLLVPLRWEGQRTNRPTIKPDLYVLAIGVSAYRDPTLHLDFPGQDARDLAATLRWQEGRRYRRVVARVLTDAAATGADIIAGLQWLRASATPGDLVAVFLAGHGVSDPSRGTYAFYPHDAEAGRPESWLPGDVLQRELSRTPGRVVLFIDTCHSGQVNLSRLVGDLASDQGGVVVYAASSPGQASIEARRWGNGAFTKALVEGLRGRADTQGVGRVSVSELETYVSDRVRALTNERQVPTSAKPGGVPDFLLSTVDIRYKVERKWWFWGSVGVAAAGLVTGALLATRPWEEKPPIVRFGVSP